MSEPTPDDLERMQTGLYARSTGEHVRTMLQQLLDVVGITPSSDGQVRGMLGVQAQLTGRVTALETAFTRISRVERLVAFAAVAVAVASLAVTVEAADRLYDKYSSVPAPAVDVHARGER